jgi:hypothetical protein
MTEQVTSTPTETQETVAAATLSHADLQNAVAIIDHAAKEGAFKGWGDMYAARVVRDKLFAFVEANRPVVEAATAAETAEANAVAAKAKNDAVVAEVGPSATKGKRKTVRKG